MVTVKDSGEPEEVRILCDRVARGEPCPPGGTGYAKAVLICHNNSHPFQQRTLNLDRPAKIGRLVSRVSRQTLNNGIFDCKVLSRNHALLWYKNGTFYIRDTKSSNGTFVNNERLRGDAKDGPLSEISSGDVVQFGVDVKVLQNNRNVTLDCIVATIKLYHPNGKEAKQTHASAATQEEICKLQFIIDEAQQREQRLHDKLEELQIILGKLSVACQCNRFQKTEAENLEKQLRVMGKTRPESMERDMQERQYRTPLMCEERLADAQRVATSLELEVATLREQKSRNDHHMQELAAKCKSYSQTVQVLQAKVAAEKSNQQLEAVDTETNTINLMSDEHNDEQPKKEKESADKVLQWLYKCYPEAKLSEHTDTVNGDHTAPLSVANQLETLRECRHDSLHKISTSWSELEAARADLEKAKKEVEKTSAKKEELQVHLESARESTNQNENDMDIGTNEIGNNETITELENEVVQQEERLAEATANSKELESRCARLMSELDAAIDHCEKLNAQSYILKNHTECLELLADNLKNIAKLEAEKKLDRAQSAEAAAGSLVSSETNTAALVDDEVNEDKGNAGNEEVVAPTVAEVDTETLKKNSLGMWEKIQRVQSLAEHLTADSSLSMEDAVQLRELLSLLAKDLVRLLLREKQTIDDKRRLQERLDKSMRQAVIADKFPLLLLGVLLYYIGESALEFLGLSHR